MHETGADVAMSKTPFLCQDQRVIVFGLIAMMAEIFYILDVYKDSGMRRTVGGQVCIPLLLRPA